MIHPPRNGGSWINPMHRPGRQPLQMVHEQGIMCAGQHHMIGALAFMLYKTRRDLRKNLFINLLIADDLTMHSALSQ